MNIRLRFVLQETQPRHVEYQTIDIIWSDGGLERGSDMVQNHKAN